MTKRAIVTGLFLLCFACPVFAQVADMERSLLEELDALNTRFSKIQFVHHVHPKGQWMVSYKYMKMNMDGNRDGTSRLSTEEVLERFMVATRDLAGCAGRTRITSSGCSAGRQEAEIMLIARRIDAAMSIGSRRGSP